MKNNQSVRIMVFGTFDIIHEGHKNFFKQARGLAGRLSPYLIVSLARAQNVKHIKGVVPDSSEQKRLAQIKKLPEVDRVVLGALGDHIPHIVKEKPDIIALGYDQKAYTHGLRLQLRHAGLDCQVIRLKSYKPRQYKTSIIKARLQNLSRSHSRRKSQWIHEK